MTERYGTTKLTTIKRDFDRLREAIQRHDPAATEAAWLNCERWVDFLMARNVVSVAPASDLATQIQEVRDAVSRQSPATQAMLSGKFRAE